MPKRIVLNIDWDKARDGWLVDDEPFPTKAQAIVYAVEQAHLYVEGGELVQVRCKGKNHRVQWERTYPRSSDPKKSKG